jgi:hypothetical protein
MSREPWPKEYQDECWHLFFAGRCLCPCHGTDLAPDPVAVLADLMNHPGVRSVILPVELRERVSRVLAGEE